MSFPEHDWRLLRSLHQAALGRYCARVLEECAAVIHDGDSPAHDRYLRLFRLLRQRDAHMAAGFDDLRRSTAIQRLAAMINLGVVTDAELAPFSPGDPRIGDSSGGNPGSAREASQSALKAGPLVIRNVRWTRKQQPGEHHSLE